MPRGQLAAKKKQSAQQLVVKLSGLMFLLGFILCGLNHRFSWLTLPAWVPLSAAAVFLLYPAIIVLRIGIEEKLLSKELASYKEYQKKVKYRLTPYLW